MSLRAFTEGRGELTTIALLHEVDAGLVRQLLPPGLSLPDHRPARLLLLQSRYHFRAWFGDMRYHEITFAIPEVASPQAPACLYMRRLYLDARLPRWLGVALYGFEKLPATLHQPPPDEAGERLVFTWHAGREATPLVHSSWEESPHDADASALFSALDLPVVSQARRRRDPDAAVTHGGPFLYTRMHTPAPARLRRVMGEVDLGAGMDPPLLAGLQLRGAQAFLLDTTQVVSLPQRRPLGPTSG